MLILIVAYHANHIEYICITKMHFQKIHLIPLYIFISVSFELSSYMYSWIAGLDDDMHWSELSLLRVCKNRNMHFFHYHKWFFFSYKKRFKVILNMYVSSACVHVMLIYIPHPTVRVSCFPNPSPLIPLTVKSVEIWTE